MDIGNNGIAIHALLNFILIITLAWITEEMSFQNQWYQNLFVIFVLSCLVWLFIFVFNCIPSCSLIHYSFSPLRFYLQLNGFNNMFSYKSKYNGTVHVTWHNKESAKYKHISRIQFSAIPSVPGEVKYSWPEHKTPFYQ